MAITERRCPNGHAVDAIDTNYCTTCGTAVSTAVPGPPVSGPIGPLGPGSSGSGNRIGLLIGGATAAVAIVAVVLALVVSGSPSIETAPPSTVVAPGHDSPFAAVTGFVDGNNRSGVPSACPFMVPYQQSLCATFPANGESVRGFGLGNAVIVGDRALVTVLSTKWCIFQSCIANADPNSGLPASTADFPSEFQYSVTHNSDPTINCDDIGGKWYVQDGSPNGS